MSNDMREASTMIRPRQQGTCYAYLFFFCKQKAELNAPAVTSSMMQARARPDGLITVKQNRLCHMPRGQPSF